MLSENIRQLENLSVYSLDQNPPLTVTLTQDQVFTETDEVFFGWAGNIAVDNEGRLFVQIGAEMGETGILVFNSDGSYKKTIGRHGGGPGEFEYIRDVTTSDEKLFVYENYEIHVFDLADLEFSHSIVIKMESLKTDSELRKLNPGSQFFVLNDSSYFFSFTSSLSQKVKGAETFKYFAAVDKHGKIHPEIILKQKEFKFYNTSVEDRLPDPLPFAMPFTRSSLVTVAANGTIFTNWNEDFLIKKFSSTGEYLSSFYYPITNAQLKKEEAYDLASDKKRKEVLRKAELPLFWPAVNSIHIDEDNRLWISTITEHSDFFEWFILNEDGKLLARLKWPGERGERKVWHPGDLIIKNNYLYKIRQKSMRDPSEIIRYKIRFTEKY